jgi:uncharacterized protein (UPF0305 family)
MGDDILGCINKSGTITPKDFCDKKKQDNLYVCIFKEKKINNNKYFCDLNICLEKINKFIKMSTG